MTDNWYFNHCCVFSCSSANILKVIFENDKKHFLDRACKEVLFVFFSFLFFFSCQLHVMTKKKQYCSKFR